MGVRRNANPSPTNRLRKKPERVFKSRKAGGMTKAEDALVEQFVKDQPSEVTHGQEIALAHVLKRSVTAIRNSIERARDKFSESAEQYVDTHLTATKNALADGDYETATKASQWAMEHLSSEGVRVIERAAKDTGPKVFVAVKIGGLDTPAPAVTIDAPDKL